MKLIPILLIKMYRLILSPILGNRCRFIPSCSVYALECFNSFPFFKALWYSSKRLCKCHPFANFGFDEVPQRSSK